MNIKYLSHLIPAVAFLALTVSCSQTYKKINYLQNVEPGEVLEMEENHGIHIQPMDMVSIVVSCHNPELARTVNLPIVSYQAGAEVADAGSNQRLIGYVVDNGGNINFPVLGTIKVAGMTRWDLQDYIKNRLIEEKYIMDPIVTVQFLNFMVTVTGEVASPGTITINGDKITVLEAIAKARDLTIFGRRDNVKIIREQDGKRVIYEVDLRDKELFKSPAYYLKQNDIVYVAPNSVRAGQSTINENSFKNVSFWVSIGSFLITVATLIVNIVPKK